MSLFEIKVNNILNKFDLQPYDDSVTLETVKDEIRRLIVPTEGPNSKWARIICNWNETDPVSRKVIREHTYAPVIDLDTENIYLDCSKLKIYTKLFFATLARPLHTVIKTLYHLFLPLSIPLEIYKAIASREPEDTKGQIAWNVFKNVAKNFADIIRTPLYGIALTIITLFGLLISPFYSNLVYDFRKLTGELERSLNWQRTDMWVKPSFWTINACFTPQRNNFVDMTNNFDEDYDEDFIKMKIVKKSPLLHSTLDALTNYAILQIQYKQTQRHPFNDCCLLLDRNEPYKTL